MDDVNNPLFEQLLQKFCAEGISAKPEAVESYVLQDGDLAIYPLGVRGEVSANERGVLFADFLRRRTGGRVELVVVGYDDDPRELWEIEEVKTYVRQFAAAAGITHAAMVLGIAGESGVALLMACGVPAPGVRLVLAKKTANPVNPALDGTHDR